MKSLPLFARVRSYGNRCAIRTESGELTYAELVAQAESVAAALLDGGTDLREARVALLASAGADYASGQLGAWLAGGVVVPLSLSATPRESAYAISDAGVSHIVASHSHASMLSEVGEASGLPVVLVGGLTAGQAAVHLPEIDTARRAMLLYTSGTTNKPKGVVTTHAGLCAQIESLVEAWRWRQDDSIPLFLPLHHVHGIVNVLLSALWTGALVEPFRRFDADAVLRRVADGAYTIFMAVPTVYTKLITLLESAPETERAAFIDGFGRMRLMVSGSAALPASVHRRWSELTGQVLLERYGMTEIGMALSNPYEGERRPGAVGTPLPGVEVRLWSEPEGVVTSEDQPGEIQVRGATIFREYWGRAEATASSFQDGWFRTGDIAVRERGYYRIMGRQSVDIIKSGGYKLSALEIEAVLLDHPAIAECAVVGVPDETWGEVVAVAVVLAEGGRLDPDALRDWAGKHLSPYKVPRRLLTVASLPRNAMGKVTKPAVLELFTRTRPAPSDGTSS